MDCHLRVLRTVLENKQRAMSEASKQHRNSIHAIERLKKDLVLKGQSLNINKNKKLENIF